MTQNVNQVIAPDGLGYPFTPSVYSSQYFPEDGIEREGNGFTLYQNVGGELIVTPGLTSNNIGLFTIQLFKRGRTMGYLNSYMIQYGIGLIPPGLYGESFAAVVK